jgi:cytochrome c biogenesis protein CcmG/thiol:disulfide interchange protein DsbE
MPDDARPKELAPCWLTWTAVDAGGSLHSDGSTAVAPRHTDRVFKWVAAAAAACLVGFVVFVIVRGPSSPSNPSGAGSAALASPPPAVLKPGTIAPAFSLVSLEGGQTVNLARYLGRPVIVNFFASWCPDCRAELAAVATVARTNAPSVAVVGVDSNESSDAAAARLLAQAHATYPVGVDPKAKVATDYLVQALPVTYFLDASGHVVGAALGPQSVTSLERWVDRLERRAGSGRS